MPKNASSPNGATGRPLTPLESAMEILTRHQGTYNILMVSRLRGPLDLDHLQRAIAHLQSSHPHLQACITGEPPKNCRFAYGQAKPIPLRILKSNGFDSNSLNSNSDGDAVELESAITQELTTPMPSDRYLMRCALLSPSDDVHHLLTTLHHGISDGASAVYLHTQILNLYSRALDPAPPWPNPAIAFGSVDDYQPAPPKGLFPPISAFFKLLWQVVLLRYRLLTQAQTYLPPVPPQTPLGQTYYHTQLTLSPSLTEALLRRCRQHQATVHGSLCAAMMVAAQPFTVSTTPEGTSLKIGCASSIDLRRRCDPPMEGKRLGIFASGLSTFHRLPRGLSHDQPEFQTTFWTLAQNVQQQLKAALAVHIPFKILPFFEGVVQQRLANPNDEPLPVQVTNLGRVDIPPQWGDLKFEGLSVMVSVARFQRTVMMSAVTFNGQMTLNFQTASPQFSQERLESLANGVVELLTLE